MPRHGGRHLADRAKHAARQCDHTPPATFVGEQIRMVFADVEVAAVKIGMLGSDKIVEAVAEALSSYRNVPIVLDPVLVATSGAPLGDDRVIAAMRTYLFPFVTLITPNLAEAARLADGAPIETRADVEDVARVLQGDGQAAWLIKGGHGRADSADDCLLAVAKFDGFRRNGSRRAIRMAQDARCHRPSPRFWPTAVSLARPSI